MNRARAAAARAKLHEALDELLDALEEGESSTPAPPKSAPRTRQGRRPRRPVVSPNVEVSELDRAAVRAELRRSGKFVEVKR